MDQAEGFKTGMRKKDKGAVGDDKDESTESMDVERENAEEEGGAEEEDV
jgi:hypothetical protein